MTKNHENKLTMYEAVQSLLEANGDKTAGIPAFVGSIASFRGAVQSIKQKSTELDAAGAGKAAAKSRAEDELLTALMPVASALFVHAGIQKDDELREKATVTEGGLRRLRDTELAGKASALLSLANERLSVLTGYGITEAALKDLQAKADAYSTSIAQRETGGAQKAGARANLLELFDVADRTLNDQLDHLIELVRRSNTQFYNEYFAARVIKDLGTRHRPPQEPAAKA